MTHSKHPVRVFPRNDGAVIDVGLVAIDASWSEVRTFVTAIDQVEEKFSRLDRTTPEAVAMLPLLLTADLPRPSQWESVSLIVEGNIYMIRYRGVGWQLPREVTLRVRESCHHVLCEFMQLLPDDCVPPASA